MLETCSCGCGSTGPFVKYQDVQFKEVRFSRSIGNQMQGYIIGPVWTCVYAWLSRNNKNQFKRRIV